MHFLKMLTLTYVEKKNQIFCAGEEKHSLILVLK